MTENKENEPTSETIRFEDVKTFLEQNDGKVKQSVLINHFRQQLSNPSTKAQARQDFKDILQLITAVKTENGEKYIVLIKQNQDHTQTLNALRKGSRTIGARKELTKSRYDFLPSATPPSLSDEEDNIPVHHGISQDSGISSDSASVQSSVSSLRTALSGKLKGTQSMDSISTCLTDETDGDIEDDLGLNDGLEVLPEEKDWMLAAAHGRLEILKKLVDKYPHLAKKKDFVMGYTALHWAAKLGRVDILKFIASVGGEICSKSHGGYTPLHLAAMSGKDQVIIMLIELYGANIHARDNSGKKPKDVVKETVAADVQRKLGRSLILENGDDIFSRKLVQASPSLQHKSFTLPSRKMNMSDGEKSPRNTPEIARRHLKSVGAQAKRSVSFLHKKKKHDNRLKKDSIQHIPEENLSPQIRHRKDTIQTLPTEEHRLKPKRESIRQSQKNRPKSQVIQTESLNIHDNNNSQPTLSFEI